MTRSELSRLGGVAVHAQGKGHEWTSATARQASLARTRHAGHRWTSDTARVVASAGGRKSQAVRRAKRRQHAKEILTKRFWTPAPPLDRKEPT